MQENNNLKNLLNSAFEARQDLAEALLEEETDTWRLFHGVNEGRPGLTIDRYGSQVLLQTFRQPLEEKEIETIRAEITEKLGIKPNYVYNHRDGNKIKNIPIEGESGGDVVSECREMGVRYRVLGIHRGLDPLLFIDLRVVRRYLKEHCKGKTLLNLFAYTGVVGVAAAAFGAEKAWNVDFSVSSLEHGKESARLNDIPRDRLQWVREDVFPVIRQFSGLGVKGKGRRRTFLHFKPRQFDFVVLDPPTLAKSPFGAVDIINDYQGLFKPALLCLKPGGTIICTNHAASVDMENWLQLLKRCATKAGKEIKKTTLLEPEKDFPSPDGKHMLKIAACQI